MFEKNLLTSNASSASADAARFVVEPSEHEAVQEASLISMDWNELIARLNAARDLRRVLRTGSSGCIDEFADAAARFLKGRDEHQRDVNLVGLKPTKGSEPIPVVAKDSIDKTTRKPGRTANAGDARED